MKRDYLKLRKVRKYKVRTFCHNIRKCETNRWINVLIVEHNFGRLQYSPLQRPLFSVEEAALP